MLANLKEVAKAATNYRAMHPISKREIAEYSRGVASAYALEQRPPAVVGINLLVRARIRSLGPSTAYLEKRAAT